jgi:hypothetical protein
MYWLQSAEVTVRTYSHEDRGGLRDEVSGLQEGQRVHKKICKRRLFRFCVRRACVVAQGFKIYPGATVYTPPDTEENREMKEALPRGTVATSYVTNDSFEKVAAFYKGFAQEYAMPGMPKGRKLQNGQELKQAYFIFDGAKDLSTSKNWAQVQRPLIGSIDENLQPRDIRDVTVINVSQRK